jgi:hypothetical protein
MLTEAAAIRLQRRQQEAITAVVREAAEYRPSVGDGDPPRLGRTSCEHSNAVEDLILQASHRIHRPPWVAVIQGLPLEDPAGTLMVVSEGLGTPLKPPGGRDVQTLSPAHDAAPDDVPLNECMHTDGTDQVHPNDYTCLFAIAADQHGGGRSQVLDVQTVLKAGPIQPLRDQLFAVALPWAIGNQAGGGVLESPVLVGPEDPAIRWMSYTVRRSETLGYRLTEAQSLLVDEFDAALRSLPPTIDCLLAPGDLLILNNRRCLHRRTPVNRAGTSRRLMLRTKLRAMQAP